METVKSKKTLCTKCPYKLGLVKAVANPCPQCKLNVCQPYGWLHKHLLKGTQDKK